MSCVYCSYTGFSCELLRTDFNLEKYFVCVYTYTFATYKVQPSKVIATPSGDQNEGILFLSALLELGQF